MLNKKVVIWYGAGYPEIEAEVIGTEHRKTKHFGIITDIILRDERGEIHKVNKIYDKDKLGIGVKWK